MSKTFQSFVRIFGPLFLIVSLITLWFVHSRNQAQQDLVAMRQQALVSQQTRLVTSEVLKHADDTQYMARLVARFVSDEPAGDMSRMMTDALMDFSRSHREYDQIRFLDETGMERVRINRTFAGAVAAPEPTLQDKSDRYYFREALKAGKNDVYISRFDLNVEHGRIELPHRPTIRFASPVIDRSGRKRGIVVMNLDGAAILGMLRTQAASGEYTTLFLSGNGNYMLGPTPDDAWGSQLERVDANMPTQFPAAWEAVTEKSEGQVLTDAGLFTFNTIPILPDTILTDMPPSPEQMQTRWKLITLVKPDNLRVSWLPAFIILSLLGMVGAGFGCWNLADHRVRQAEAEARLRESEERTLAISRSAQDAIIMVDHTDSITYWNPASERLFGYKAAEVIGNKLHNLLVPEHLRSKVEHSFEDFALTGKGPTVGKTLEFDAVKKDGSLVPVEVAVSSFQLKGTWYAVGSIRDATARRQFEEDLRRSEETGRALINAPADSALLIEPGGTILAINDIGAHRLGGSVEEMVGKNIFEINSPELARGRRAILKEVLESGEPTKFEEFRSGRHLLNTVYPSKGADGKVDRLAVFVRDVTEQYQAQAALKHSEQRFRDVSEAVGEYIWETDAQGNFTFITDDVTIVLGYSADELLGTTPFKLIPAEDAEDIKDMHTELFNEQLPFHNIELRNVTKDGRIIWLQVSGVPYFDDSGEFQGYRGAAMNISDRKAQENAILASERKLRALADSAYDAIIMIDNNGRISFWNSSAEELFGFTEEEALGRNVHRLISPPEQHSAAEVGMYQFALTGQGDKVGQVREVIGVRKDGTRVPVDLSLASFQLNGQWYAVGTIRDITERKAQEAKLRELATTDSLTGLYNRHRFMELSERELARSSRYERQLSMFMIDIDHFKQVNDTHGHDVGDEVLRGLAEIAVLALRNADIIGRLGGEEFGVLLPETGEQAALEVAERLRMSVERAHISTAAGEVTFTISIGVAVMNGDTPSIEKLMKKADVALYDAKQSGRNRVVLA